MKAARKERIGWYFYDWANSAFYTTVITVFLGPYLTEIAKSAAGADGMVHLLGIPIYYASFFAYTVSLSVLLQVIILPLVGAFADYTNRKKQLLGLFAYIGSIATMGLYFLEGGSFLLGGILFIVANLSFGSSIVVYNAFLSEIAEADKRDAVSSLGWAIGYLGGGLLLLLNLLLFSNAEALNISTGHAVRISLCSAGLWWGLFTLIPLILLKVRKPRISIPKGERLLSTGFRQLRSTLKDIRNHPRTLTFLIAYLLYNDGVQTVIVIATQFGKDEIGLTIDTLTQVILMVQFLAFGGALIFRYIAAAMGGKRAIMLSLVIWCGALIYAYAFLYTEMDFWILAVVIALVMGGTQALSRSQFSLLIPAGKEAEYFSFYEISDRGTSWLGPLFFGIALQLTGSYRIAILSLVFFFFAGFVLLLKVKISANKE